ncbi:hypothetical protein PHJA_001776500 [Phtheirospermum japonicum]|uniref:Uncharacterized protein n=1 Tax=Phtheirospermum japonicum TaxID=374723 RepID=A0A830CJ59_9LAMI|nr:hypothetical protein PHJA_001776500 [Phtheirospermum japonicum]
MGEAFGRKLYAEIFSRFSMDGFQDLANDLRFRLNLIEQEITACTGSDFWPEYLDHSIFPILWADDLIGNPPSPPGPGLAFPGEFPPIPPPSVPEQALHRPFPIMARPQGVNPPPPPPNHAAMPAAFPDLPPRANNRRGRPRY